jgi:hypothetical protein
MGEEIRGRIEVRKIKYKKYHKKKIPKQQTTPIAMF